MLLFKSAEALDSGSATFNRLDDSSSISLVGCKSGFSGGVNQFQSRGSLGDGAIVAIENILLTMPGVGPSSNLGVTRCDNSLLFVNDRLLVLQDQSVLSLALTGSGLALSLLVV